MMMIAMMMMVMKNNKPSEKRKKQIKNNIKLYLMPYNTHVKYVEYICYSLSRVTWFIFNQNVDKQL